MFREKMASRVTKVGMVSIIIVALIFSGISVIFPADLNADAQILGGEYGGNLRVALKAEPNTFNPKNAIAQFKNLIYVNLSAAIKSGAIVPHSTCPGFARSRRVSLLLPGPGVRSTPFQL